MHAGIDFVMEHHERIGARIELVLTDEDAKVAAHHAVEHLEASLAHRGGGAVHQSLRVSGVAVCFPAVEPFLERAVRQVAGHGDIRRRQLVASPVHDVVPLERGSPRARRGAFGELQHAVDALAIGKAQRAGRGVERHGPRLGVVIRGLPVHRQPSAIAREDEHGRRVASPGGLELDAYGLTVPLGPGLRRYGCHSQRLGLRESDMAPHRQPLAAVLSP